MKNFMKCGICGWCLELLWTSLHSLSRQVNKMIGSFFRLDVPDLWHGCHIGPLSRKLKNQNIALRGMLYMNGIFTMEYLDRYPFKKT